MKRIFKVFNFGIINYKDAERLICSMAEKGYEFKGTGKGWIKGFAMFEKNEKAKSFKYSVDIKYGLLEEEQDELQSFYSDLGWEYADCYNRRIYIFVRKENAKVSFPLYTDEDSRYENFRNTVRDESAQMGNIAAACFTLFLAGVIYQKSDLWDSRLVSYVIFIVFLAIGLLCTIYSIDNFLYRKKCEKAATAGEPIPNNFITTELKKWESLVNIILFIGVPIITILGYWHEIWGGGMYYVENLSKGLLMTMFCISLTATPGALISNYFMYLHPKNNKLKIFTYIIGFLYMISFCTYINIFSINFL